jgi:hypothetical protein
VTTLFSTDTELASLRADTSSDRFSDGMRRRYPGTERPITRLRKVGEHGGKFYYAAAEDTSAKLPVIPPTASPVSPTPVAIGGRLGGRELS